MHVSIVRDFHEVHAQSAHEATARPCAVQWETRAAQQCLHTFTCKKWRCQKCLASRCFPSFNPTCCKLFGLAAEQPAKRQKMFPENGKKTWQRRSFDNDDIEAARDVFMTAPTYSLERVAGKREHEQKINYTKNYKMVSNQIGAPFCAVFVLFVAVVRWLLQNTQGRTNRYRKPKWTQNVTEIYYFGTESNKTKQFKRVQIVLKHCILDVSPKCSAIRPRRETST